MDWKNIFTVNPVLTNAEYSKTFGGYYQSVWKSVIQKAVRRGQAGRAKRAARILCEMRPLDFARRVPVILVEEGMPQAVFEAFSFGVIGILPSYTWEKTYVVQIIRFTQRMRRKLLC